MVMKPGKVLCCMFLFAILGVNLAQNLACLLSSSNQQKHFDYVIHTWPKNIKQKMCGIKGLVT